MFTLHEIVLVFSSFVLVSGVPLYKIYRDKMVSSQKSGKGVFNARKILMLMLVNLAMVVGSLTLLLTVLYGVMSVGKIDGQKIVLMYLFFVTQSMAFMGSGIYMTSIVLERYTLPSLRKHPAFDTQFIATHLFHGPISHVMIFSNIIIALLILSILDLSIYSHFNDRAPWLILAGGIAGSFYAYAQIYNKTYPYQFFTAIGALCVFAIVVLVRHTNALASPTATYFVGFEATFLLTNVNYFILKILKKEKLSFTEAGKEEVL